MKYPASSFVLNCKGAHVNSNAHGCLFVFGAMTLSKDKQKTTYVTIRGQAILSGSFLNKTTIRS